MRCGDSYQTLGIPRAIAARNAALRAPDVRGGKPSNTKRRTSKPESTAAQANAVGPGSTSTGMPAARAAATSALPGSLMPGMPASVTTATLPAGGALEDRGGRRRRVVLVIGPDLRAGDAVRGEQPARDARILGHDQFGLAQRIERAQRDVAQIAERRRNEGQPHAA